MSPKITVIGSLNMDLIVEAPHIPAPGETVIGGAFYTAVGGKGANQAVAAARLGAQVTMVGRLGDDAYGQAQIEGMRAEGIDTTYIKADPESHTGVALITVEESGQNSIVVSPGANWRLSAIDVNAVEDAIANADIVLLQLEVRDEVIECAVDLATRHNIPILLNPAPARPLKPELLGKVAYLIPNESETALYTNQAITDRASALAAAEKLRQIGIGVVILTLGSQGALLHTVDLTEHISAFPVNPVDTTAAGDAFVAGFAVAVASGHSLVAAVRFAAATGALATTKPGAQPSLPKLAEVQKLFQAFVNLI